MNKSRKLAIKNLKGSEEKLRLSWMIDNMENNKTFKYFSKENDNVFNKKLLQTLRERYSHYRKQWRGIICNISIKILKCICCKIFMPNNPITVW